MVATLTASDALPPISPAAPCGPDLDAEGDLDFLNFMAETDGQLPASYLSFDKNTIDFGKSVATGRQLLERTLDLRLVVLLAKLAILDRDINGFAFWVGEAARLLRDYWEEVHPRGEDEDFQFRIAQLSTLDDGPVVVLPLQHAPLAETQREGAVTFRAQLVATGDATRRENETLPDGGAIERILLNCDLALLSKTLTALQTVQTALADIQRITTEKVGGGDAAAFPALAPLASRMAAFVQAAVARRDPSVATPEPTAATVGGEGASSAAQAAPSAPAAFSSLAEVDAALAGAFDYFATYEPSSAAVLLIGQARQLLGKNLYEVMKILAPSYADAARVFVGPEPTFTVPVSSIAERATSSEGETPPPQAAPSRAVALALVEAVAAHLRKVEPSSPAPFLLDRARALASRDFLGLLRELLPEETLDSMKKGS